MDAHALDDIERNCDFNIFKQIKTIHVEVESESNELIYVQSEMDDEENSNLNHSSSMATRSENLQREIEFIQAWINNPNTDPLRLID